MWLSYIDPRISRKEVDYILREKSPREGLRWPVKKKNITMTEVTFEIG